MALTWEKWLQLFKKKNPLDISHLVTPENYNNISFWGGNPGITICMSRPTNSTSPPFDYGIILTMVVGGDVSQMFFRQSTGEVLRRSGNANGWNGSSTLNGKDAWKNFTLTNA